MSDVFFSYASEDRRRVEVLARAVEQSGWSVWWDRHIPVGRTFDQVIEEALADASCVLVAWSEYSVVSRWVVAEAEEAVRRNVIIPVLLDDVRLPIQFRRYQTVNLIGW